MAGARSDLRELRDRPLVFVDDLARIELEDGDRHHLERVLRIRPGTVITVSDGAGHWRRARFGPVLEADGEVVTERRPRPPLTVAFAPVKGDRSDLVVQKLTELGIDTIVPLETERSVVRWDDRRAARNLERHRRIAREAAMQSRGVWLPTIELITTLRAFLTAAPAAVLADPAGSELDGTETVMAIGPEGGFSGPELSGRESRALPGRILRTETAAIAAAVLLAASRRR